MANSYARDNKSKKDTKYFTSLLDLEMNVVNSILLVIIIALRTGAVSAKDV